MLNTRRRVCRAQSRRLTSADWALPGNAILKSRTDVERVTRTGKGRRPTDRGPRLTLGLNCYSTVSVKRRWNTLHWVRDKGNRNFVEYGDGVERVSFGWKVLVGPSSDPLSTKDYAQTLSSELVSFG